MKVCEQIGVEREGQEGPSRKEGNTLDRVLKLHTWKTIVNSTVNLEAHYKFEKFKNSHLQNCSILNI